MKVFPFTWEEAAEVRVQMTALLMMSDGFPDETLRLFSQVVEPRLKPDEEPVMLSLCNQHNIIRINTLIHSQAEIEPRHHQLFIATMDRLIVIDTEAGTSFGVYYADIASVRLGMSDQLMNTLECVINTLQGELIIGFRVGPYASQWERLTRIGNQPSELEMMLYPYAIQALTNFFEQVARALR